MLQKALVCVAVAACSLQGAAVAAPDSYNSQIQSLTNDILKREIDFERSYVRYRIAGSREPRLRRLRYFLLQQAATGGALAASTVNTVESGKNLTTPERVKADVLRRGYVSGMIGGIVGGASDGIELSSNALTAVQNKLRRQDPYSELKTVLARVTEINQLLARRKELVERQSGPVAELLSSEGKILEYFRDWCLFEFADVYADVRSNQSSSNVYYALDMIAQVLSGTTYGMSIHALKHPQTGGTISIAGMVGDAFFMIGAPASSLAGSLLYKFWYRRLAKQLGTKLYDPEQQAKGEMSKLNTLLSNGGDAETLSLAPMKVRTAIYELWSERYDGYIDKRMAHLRHLSKVALQNNISGPAISANYLASDLMNTIAFYKLKERPKAVNSLAFSGATASSAASLSSLVLSTKWLIDEKRFERKLRRQNALPSQLLEARLSTLSELDSMLGTGP